MFKILNIQSDNTYAVMGWIENVWNFFLIGHNIFLMNIYEILLQKNVGQQLKDWLD